MKALTPVNVYDTALTFPEDGIDPRRADTIEPSVQKLLNSIDHTKLRVDGLENLRPFAQYRISGAAVAAGSKFSLSTWTSGGGVFTLATNEIEVPAAGYYQIDVEATAILASSADYAIGLYIGGVIATGRRLTGPDSGTVYRPYVLSHIANITAPATQKIDLRVVETTQSLHSDVGLDEYCTLTLRRVF